MKSRFARHAAFWLIMPIVLVLSAPAIPDRGLFMISEGERAANRQMLGDSAYRELERRVDQRFTRWFIDSGIIRLSFQALAPKGGKQVFEAAAQNSFASGRYLTRVWTAIYKALYRFEVAMHWLAALGIIVFACLMDGIMRRRIKTYEFGYANPVAFHISGHGLLAVLGLITVTPFMPFAIQQWTWPVLIGLAGLVAWKAAESYQSSL
ncbi:MAG: DUF4400 domain-containing protein [Pseudomonadota bacterium]|jgi:hypothetical protein